MAAHNLKFLCRVNVLHTPLPKNYCV